MHVCTCMCARVCVCIVHWHIETFMVTCVAQPCSPLCWCGLIWRCVLLSVFRSSRSSLWFCHPKNWSPSRTSLWSSKVWNGCDVVVEGTVRVPLSQVGWAILLCPFIPGGVDSFLASHGHWFHSVQFKVQSMSSEKPIYAQPCLSEISLTLPLKQFDSSDPFDLGSFVTGGADGFVASFCHRWCSLVVSLCHRWCGQFGYVPLSQVVHSLVMSFCHRWCSLVVSLCLRWCSLVVSLHHRWCSLVVSLCHSLVQTVWFCSLVTGGADSLVVSLCHRWCSLDMSLCQRWCSLVVSLCHRWSVWLCSFFTGGADSLVMFLFHRWCRQFSCVPLSQVVQTVWLCPFVTGDVDRDCVPLWTVIVSLCHRWCWQFVSPCRRWYGQLCPFVTLVVWTVIVSPWLSDVVLRFVINYWKYLLKSFLIEWPCLKVVLLGQVGYSWWELSCPLMWGHHTCG